MQSRKMSAARLLRLRWFLLASSVALIAFAMISVWVGAWLSVPAPAPIPRSPPGAEVVVFPSRSGSQISGWLFGGENCGVVILMHPVRANRTAMLERAEFLVQQGYSVLLFDFQAHGLSPGSHITFGRLESLDAAAAVDFVKQRYPGDPIGALGASLGGAAVLVGSKPLPLSALVLEAVYPTLRAAVGNRIQMRLGPLLSSFLTPVLLMQLRPRLGFGPADLRPVDGIADVSYPLLIVAGSDDEHTTLNDSQQLFAAAPEPKDLWVVSGARHVDFLRYDPEGYRRVVGSFFSRYMDCRDAGAPSR